MKKLIATLAFAFAAGSASTAWAGNNAAPFGLEIGAATLAQAQKELGGSVSLTSQGQNKYSAGPMYQVNGASTGVEGVNSVLLIFNASNVLEGVIVTMRKDAKAIFKTLSAKYPVVSNNINDFMNFGSATLRKGDSIIEIDSPHLRSDMEVRYVSTSLMNQFQKTTASEKAATEKKKSNVL